MTDQSRAIEFIGAAPTTKMPFKPHGDGGSDLILEVGRDVAAEAEAFWRRSQGRYLRIVAEIVEPNAPASRVGEPETP